jgi:hypothetical protein
MGFVPLETGADTSILVDWRSVVDYGATGDGTTDDTAAIQAAIDATPRAGTCYFPVPDAYYRVVSTLTIPRAMRIAGAGTYPPTQPDGGVPQIRMVTANTTLFQGPGTTEYVSFDGLALRGVVGSQTGGAGIDLTQSAVINRTFISGFQDGIRLTATSPGNHLYHAIIRDSQTDRCTRAGLRSVGEVNNLTIVAFTTNWCAAGVQLVGGGMSVRMLGGAHDMNDVGVSIEGTSTYGHPTTGVLISGVWFEQASGDTDIAIGKLSTVYTVKVDGCTFVRPNLTGSGWHIDAERVVGLTVTANEFMSTDAVRAVSPATRVVLANNRNRNNGTVTLPAGSLHLDPDANVAPEPVGVTAVAGVSPYLARADHVHEGATATADPDTHRLVVLHDFGSGLEPVTDDDGLWLYGAYPGTAY